MIGERIKSLRESKGYNMRQMAAALNLPYTTYVNYEKGAREPNSEQLILISKYFGVSIDYLMGRTDIPEFSVDYLTGSKITLDFSYIDETKEYCKKHFPKHSKDVEAILNDLDNLNDRGISEVCKRVHELTLISDYSNLCLPETNTARIAAYGGGTKDIPAANVTKEELEQLEALQRGLNEVAEIDKKLRN